MGRGNQSGLSIVNSEWFLMTYLRVPDDPFQVESPSSLTQSIEEFNARTLWLYRRFLVTKEQNKLFHFFLCFSVAVSDEDIFLYLSRFFWIV